MIRLSLSCFRNLCVEAQCDGMASDTDCRLTCERDAHNAASTSISDDG